MPAWTHTITIGGLDVTNQVTLDSVRIEESESSSFLCDLRWRSGLEQTGLQSKEVIVSVNMGGGATDLFKGAIIRTEWDPKGLAYTLRASTRLQRYFRELGTEQAVRDALAPANVQSSADWLGEPPDDLWEYAEQLLETAPVDAHIDRTGALKLTAWEAALTPDFQLGPADVDDESEIALIEQDADVKTNRVICELEYSVMRWKIRSHTMLWDFIQEPETNDFCQWIQGTNGAYWPPPVLSQVVTVFDPDSWSVRRLNADQIPLDEPDLCFVGNAPLGWQFERDSNPLMRCSAVGYKPKDQEIREKYTITINATASQTTQGEIVTERRSAQMKIDPPAGWPPEHVEPPALPNASTDTLGDLYEDKIDDARRTSMFDTMYAWARARCLEGQRGDSRRVRTILRPDITLDHTVEITALGLTTKGKVRRLIHTLAPLRTVIDAARSIPGGADDPYSAPARPDTSDPITYWETLKRQTDPGYNYPTPAAITNIPTYVGARPTSPNEDTFTPDQMGYWTNAVNYPGFGGEPEKIYDDLVFRAVWPGVEEEMSDGVEVQTNVSYEVAIPE